ncbi:amidohydrolase family protein [Pseudomonadota bacterium]
MAALKTPTGLWIKLNYRKNIGTITMSSNKNLGVEFVGCNLKYGKDSPAFEKDPSTIHSHTPRPIKINGKSTKVIDMHAHCQVSAVRDLVHGRPELEGFDPYALAAMTRVENLQTRIEEMDRMGIDMQVLSIGLEQYYFWADRELATKVVKMQNEMLSQICAEHPDRFVPLGAVSLQHPDLAVKQLEYAVKNLGHRGCMIAGSVLGKELADAEFEKFWAKAEELDVVVFIHPRRFVEGETRLQGRGFLINIIGQPLETTVALSHLIYEGTLDRYPGLKIVAAHGGGYLPSYIGRSDHGHTSDDRGARGLEKKKPSEYLKQIYYDTLVYNTENLAHLIREVGVSQLVIGTDHPWGMTNLNPVAHLLSVPGLSEDDIEDILCKTAKKLFKIDG